MLGFQQLPPAGERYIYQRCRPMAHGADHTARVVDRRDHPLHRGVAREIEHSALSADEVDP